MVKDMAVMGKLRNGIGRTVTLTFNDGEVVDAAIKEVDTEEHDDLFYEVVRVRTPGPRQSSTTGLVRAAISDILTVSDPCE